MSWIDIKYLVKLIAAVVLGKKYWNYRFYPKRSQEISARGAFGSHNLETFSIVLQGPVLVNDNFTIETLRLYKKLFPLAHIILSTWSLTKSQKSILSDMSINYIENHKPDNPGISNINMQIQTSKSGLLLAKKLGAQYAVKTRTDQRIYHPSLYAYLRNLLNLFPLKNKVLAQHERLIGVSLNTFKYRMYGLSDMFLFGQIDDMLLYWNIPFDPRIDTSEEQSNAGNSWKEFAKWRVCETYLCTEFLDRVGHKTKFTLTDSFVALSEHFVVIDSESIKLFWNKYTLNADRYSAFGFFDPQVSFNDWLMMYENTENVSIDHSIIDQPISTERG
ncbi:WavE lipopolysaccharide synthesis family protein [Planktomarina temperata]|nr:WavE lipopolysaccharide synthesis family protein [Planktomarina temperata]